MGDSGARKKSVLIVEDERDLVEVLVARLKSWGYLAGSAHDGREALEAVKIKKPDLILLDYMLPGMDGLQVCRILKKDPVYSSIQILVISACASTLDRERLLEAGAEGFLAKPFEPQTLRAEMERLLSKAAA